MAKLLIINGPNLNLLGQRETKIYGHTSLDELNQALAHLCLDNNHQLESYQSNSESSIIDTIHLAKDKIDFIIINPAAYTHTSIAIRDALLGVSIPFIEVHLSNTAAREAFRKISYLSDIALGTISGFGTHSYYLALDAAFNYLKSAKN